MLPPKTWLSPALPGHVPKCPLKSPRNCPHVGLPRSGQTERWHGFFCPSSWCCVKYIEPLVFCQTLWNDLVCYGFLCVQTCSLFLFCSSARLLTTQPAPPIPHALRKPAYASLSSCFHLCEGLCFKMHHHDRLFKVVQTVESHTSRYLVNSIRTALMRTLRPISFAQCINSRGKFLFVCFKYTKSP